MDPTHVHIWCIWTLSMFTLIMSECSTVHVCFSVCTKILQKLPQRRELWLWFSSCTTVAVGHDTTRYDTIRYAILTCARKPTWVSLIYRTDVTMRHVIVACARKLTDSHPAWSSARSRKTEKYWKKTKTEKTDVLRETDDSVKSVDSVQRKGERIYGGNRDTGKGWALSVRLLHSILQAAAAAAAVSGQPVPRYASCGDTIMRRFVYFFWCPKERFVGLYRTRTSGVCVSLLKPCSSWAEV